MYMYLLPISNTSSGRHTCGLFQYLPENQRPGGNQEAHISSPYMYVNRDAQITPARKDENEFYGGKFPLLWG